MNRLGMGNASRQEPADDGEKSILVSLALKSGYMALVMSTKELSQFRVVCTIVNTMMEKGKKRFGLRSNFLTRRVQFVTCNHLLSPATKSNT